MDVVHKPGNGLGDIVSIFVIRGHDGRTSTLAFDGQPLTMSYATHDTIGYAFHRCTTGWNPDRLRFFIRSICFSKFCAVPDLLSPTCRLGESKKALFDARVFAKLRGTWRCHNGGAHRIEGSSYSTSKRCPSPAGVVVNTRCLISSYCSSVGNGSRPGTKSR